MHICNIKYVKWAKKPQQKDVAMNNLSIFALKTIPDSTRQGVVERTIHISINTNLKKPNTMKAINYLLAFIGGAAVGAAAGILFAPEKGSDTRAMIVENLKKRGIKLSKKEMEDLASDIAEDLGLDNAE